jgi:hypothetical protein
VVYTVFIRVSCFSTNSSNIHKQKHPEEFIR